MHAQGGVQPTSGGSDATGTAPVFGAKLTQSAPVISNQPAA